MSRHGLALILGIALIAGCAPTTPTPTPVVPNLPPSSTASPAPSALASATVDLPAALRDILRSPGPYQMTQTRSQSGDTGESSIAGTMQVDGHAWAASGKRTDTPVGGPAVEAADYDMVWIGDSGFTRRQGGPWIPFVGLFDHPLRFTADPDAGSFVETRTFVQDGVTLHRLEYVDPSVIDPVFVLAIADEITDVEATASYDLTGDGHLVAVHAEVSAQRLPDFGSGPLAHVAEYRVTGEAPVTIDAPKTAWTLTGTRDDPFSFALPPGWTQGAIPLAGHFSGPEGTLEVRSLGSPVTSTPEQLVDAVKVKYAKLGAKEPSSILPTYVGGKPATAVIYRAVDLGDGQINVIDIVSVVKDAAWEQVWTMSIGQLQDKFDLIGRVATSWHWR